MKFIIAFIFLGLFTSCFDIIEVKHKITDSYYVKDDPSNARQTLYRKTIDGNFIGRVSNILKAGHIRNIIVAKTHDGYYFFDSNKDNELLNSNEIVGQIRTQNDFQNLIDSMKVKNFKFDYDQ